MVNYGKIIKTVATKIGGPGAQKAVSMGILKFKKASPTIMMVGGVIGIVGSGVLACRATLRVEEVIDEANEALDDIHHAVEQYDESVYSEEDAKKDTTVVYTRSFIQLARLYGPSIIMGAASIGLILCSHHVMKQRNLALMSAYETIKTGFDEYRKRVKESLGDDKDREFRYGLKTDELVYEEDNPGQRGRKKKIREEIKTFDPNEVSIYARFFDEGSTEWENNPEYNLMKVKQVQAWANDYLHANGYLFLNDVYDELGIPRTSEGQLVGWLIGHGGDEYVDFGIYTNAFKNDPDGEVKRDFVNGRESCILLDFNVDGPIFRYI